MSSTRLTREPRDWKRLWSAYVGHFVQGLVSGAVLPFIWQPYLFTNYQRSEFEAYWKRNEVGDYKAHDMVSRDIADYTAGNLLGSIAAAVFWLVILL